MVNLFDSISSKHLKLAAYYTTFEAYADCASKVAARLWNTTNEERIEWCYISSQRIHSDNLVNLNENKVVNSNRYKIRVGVGCVRTDTHINWNKYIIVERQAVVFAVCVPNTRQIILSYICFFSFFFAWFWTVRFPSHVLLEIKIFRQTQSGRT